MMNDETYKVPDDYADPDDVTPVDNPESGYELPPGELQENDNETSQEKQSGETKLENTQMGAEHEPDSGTGAVIEEQGSPAGGNPPSDAPRQEENLTQVETATVPVSSEPPSGEKAAGAGEESVSPAEEHDAPEARNISGTVSKEEEHTPVSSPAATPAHAGESAAATGTETCADEPLSGERKEEPAAAGDAEESAEEEDPVLNRMVAELVVLQKNLDEDTLAYQSVSGKFPVDQEALMAASTRLNESINAVNKMKYDIEEYKEEQIRLKEEKERRKKEEEEARLKAEEELRARAEQIAAEEAARKEEEERKNNLTYRALMNLSDSIDRKLAAQERRTDELTDAVKALDARLDLLRQTNIDPEELADAIAELSNTVDHFEENIINDLRVNIDALSSVSDSLKTTEENLTDATTKAAEQFGAYARAVKDLDSTQTKWKAYQSTFAGDLEEKYKAITENFKVQVQNFHKQLAEKAFSVPKEEEDKSQKYIMYALAGATAFLALAVLFK